MLKIRGSLFREYAFVLGLRYLKEMSRSQTDLIIHTPEGIKGPELLRRSLSSGQLSRLE
jgi:hypothetical protein